MEYKTGSPKAVSNYTDIIQNTPELSLKCFEPKLWYWTNEPIKLWQTIQYEI